MVFTLPDIDPEDLLVEGVKPRLFISYSHAYLSQVGSIVKRLEDAYYDPWFDTRDIPGGEDWKREIAKGIQSAQRVLFFMAPESCDSEYCQGEIAHALKHNVPVIPIRINNITPDDALKKVGLSGKQFIKWDSEDEKTNWKRLLTDHNMVEPPLSNEIRRLDPEYERLHRRYLNTFFRPEFCRVSLSDISEDAPVRGVPLTSVYVPLPVDMSVTIRVDKTDKKTITDWWVKVERSDTRADENIPDELRERKLREWISLGVGEDGLRLLLDDVERKLAERAQTEQEFHPEQHWLMEAHDAANIQSRMVLTGIPGSGKSTFLKHLALCLAGHQLKDKEDANIEALKLWTLPAYTPVFIRLVDIVKQEFPLKEDRADTEDFDLYIQKQLAGWHIQEYWRDLQDQLYDGSAIILLDGLDEVPNAVEKWRREQIMDFVGAIINEYGKCRVIVTSRPYAYDGTWKLDKFGQTTLIPLPEQRIDELAQALFAQLPNMDDPTEEARAFVTALHKQDREDGFWNNPLQFTMGATLWVRHSDQPVTERIPPTPALLYDRCVDLMLEKWAKRDPVIGASVAELLQVTTEQLRTALERLALQMQADYGSDGKATFDWIMLIKHLEETRREDNQDRVRLPSIDYNLALDLLEQRAGLLASEESRVYRFQHLSYQEYLAAFELAKPAHFPKAIAEKIIAQPGRWRNVVPLLTDIITQRGMEALQTLTRALLPKQDTSGLASDDNLWEVVAHAARLYGSNEAVLDDSQKQRLGNHLVNLIGCGALAPAERAEMGRILTTIGDTRKGVGNVSVHVDGTSIELPDIDWVEIPAGDFSYQDKTMPLDYGFEISRYPVTYAQFQAFLDDPEGCTDNRWWQGLPEESKPTFGEAYPTTQIAEQYFKYWNHPRETVSWYQAIAFCRWYSWRLGGGYDLDAIDQWAVRLPTEFEWEKAARANTGWAYPYGSEFDASKGNTDETGIRQTSAVGIFAAGDTPHWDKPISDLSGNVWEWCLTEYENPEPDVSEMNMRSNGLRVLRGGSFYGSQGLARAVYRFRSLPSYRDHDVGFRLVRPPSR